MTDVAGPPGPVGRFFALPIRGQNDALSADGSRFRVRCDMAQALNIPMRGRMAPWDPSPGAIAASHRSRSPLPVSPARERPFLADMGQGQGLRKRAGRGPDAPETVRFPDP